MPIAALLPLVAQFAPQLIAHLLGPRSGAIADSVAQVVQTVTGATDPGVATATAEAFPGKATELRVKLADIAAQAAQAERQAELDTFRAQLADTASARGQTVALAQANSKIAWAAPVISLVVVTGFYLSPVIGRAFALDYPEIWQGAQIAAFTSVVAYWIGASASGRRAQEANQASTEKVTQAATEVISAARQALPAPAPPLPLPAPAAAPPTPAALAAWTRFDGGLGWRVTPDGIVTETDPEPLRTVGEPVTIARIWASYGSIIQAVAAELAIPAEVVVMTIALESNGNPKAYRREPDGRESSGLMQTLLGTAAEVLGKAVSVADLQDPATSIRAGALYLKKQAAKTGMDPIKCAAAYNAGGLYSTRDNRWHLRSYGNHLDKAAMWWGDVCVVKLRDRWFT